MLERITERDEYDLRFLVKGPKGVVQFLIFNPDSASPVPVDVGYHSPVPQLEGQTARDDCPYVQPCYYDGSSLAAMAMWQTYMEAGEDVMWADLEAYYTETFGE